ncbi:MAG: histidine phosphatase family protein [Hydrogenophaga sp.]|jgi:broad specificity phosphatase PhoE|uniref:histidine phosphatase family protein n=1 Tax=Hydrogenophaga sp. TaxID=1904254 RepID=UPI0025C08D17|nr:histidine phosphatase family protein [Hydrogenophaga sp.]MDO8888883.1 histidine phosphatase family protein [Hydrogenophaga sp.]MDO9506808.1 histidine phosphatase family protein [Hydrogenophaga sp.]MDP1781095.1 histidine phosphatase family protein [Hydrogenophaga sp.]MDP2985504.1 histidine phosphatase family protein [Hydrogenophaga sp.]MDP3202916.1 histidine phosphatase family protein [Hydrogenophaga sp.]
MNRREFALTSAVSLGSPALPAFAQAPGFWTLLREGGCVVLMRHALTDPGVGDPPNFKLGECGTQRNLSAAGREQARRVGAAFLREQVKLDQVRSSAWCRCVDTAMLAFKQNTVWPPINSFFGAGGQDEQTRAVLDAVEGWQAPRNLMLVTHQVNISALTGDYLAMGEVLVTRPGAQGSKLNRLRVLARQTF